jgi:hypothetical protein
MVSLLGISIVLAAAGPAPATPKPLDPAVEAALAFVTDGKGMSKLRGKGVVARFKGILPVQQTKKEQYSWVFQGQAAEGPIAAVLVDFEYGPEFMDVDFRLRSTASKELSQVLIARIKSKLGKPAFINESDDKKSSSVHWNIGTTWTVSVRHDDARPGQVTLDVTQYRESEEGGGGEE